MGGEGREVTSERKRQRERERERERESEREREREDGCERMAETVTGIENKKERVREKGWRERAAEKVCV